MSRELDRQIGAMLGYTVYHYDKDYAENCYYQLVDESFTPVVYAPHYATGQRKTEDEAWEDLPFFSTDRAAAALVEDEIDRRGLGTQYAKYPGRIVLGEDFDFTSDGDEGGYLYHSDVWALLRATPEQRCRAALAVS